MPPCPRELQAMFIFNDETGFDDASQIFSDKRIYIPSVDAFLGDIPAIEKAHAESFGCTLLRRCPVVVYFRRTMLPGICEIATAIWIGASNEQS